MKRTPVSRLVSRLLLGAPLIAEAHPGHFVLDPNGGAPHGGHEVELGLIFAGFVLTLAVYAVRSGWGAGAIDRSDRKQGTKNDHVLCSALHHGPHSAVRRLEKSLAKQDLIGPGGSSS